MSPPITHRPTDEHMSLPTWRVRQLQDIEHAARLVAELIDETKRRALDDPGIWKALADEAASLLEQALGDD
jgi:hypothetical protein